MNKEMLNSDYSLAAAARCGGMLSVWIARHAIECDDSYILLPRKAGFKKAFLSFSPRDTTDNQRSPLRIVHAFEHRIQEAYG